MGVIPDIGDETIDMRVDFLEKRVTKHGQQIDLMHDALTQALTENKARDQTLGEIRSSIDRMDGKLDARTIEKSAGMWDKAIGQVVGLIIAFAAGAILMMLQNPR